MTDARETTPDSTRADAGAVDLAGAAPRLPDAAPAPTPTPAATPDPHAEPATVEPTESPAPATSRTPLGFVVLMLIIVGAIGVIAAVVRPWESGSDDPATVVVDDSTAQTAAPSTDPPATVPATTVPASTVAESNATTTLVVGPLPTSETAAGADAPTDPFAAQTEACAIEQRTVSIGVEAFVALTGAPPTDAEALVTEGLLKPHPDGWSTRWTFALGDGDAITVVPVSGGDCDL